MKEGVWLISILLKMKFARSWYVELYTRNSKRAPHFSKLMLRNNNNTILGGGLSLAYCSRFKLFHFNVLYLRWRDDVISRKFMSTSNIMSSFFHISSSLFLNALIDGASTILSGRLFHCSVTRHLKYDFQTIFVNGVS